MNFFGAFSAFMSSVTWAVGTSVYSRITKDHPPFALNATRAFLAMPFFLAALIIQNGLTLTPFNDVTNVHLYWLTLSMISTYALGDVCFFFAAHRIGTSSALAIASIYPLWSALFGYVFLNQALGLFKTLSLFIIVAGVITVIISGHKISTESRAKSIQGFTLAALTSLLWATNSFAVNRGSIGINTFTICLIRMALGFMLCPIVGWIMQRKITTPLLPMKVIKKNLLVFLFEGVGGSLFFVFGFQHTPIAVATVLASLAPVLSIPIAIRMKTDHFTTAKAVGVVLVVIGVAVLVC